MDRNAAFPFVFFVLVSFMFFRFHGFLSLLLLLSSSSLFRPVSIFSLFFAFVLSMSLWKCTNKQTKKRKKESEKGKRDGHKQTHKQTNNKSSQHTKKRTFQRNEKHFRPYSFFLLLLSRSQRHLSLFFFLLTCEQHDSKEREKRAKKEKKFKTLKTTNKK